MLLREGSVHAIMPGTTTAKSKMDSSTGDLEAFPTEIRMRIYSHLLGGRTFHVGVLQTEILSRARLCQSVVPPAITATSRDCESAGQEQQKLSARPVTTHAHKGYHDVHHACGEHNLKNPVHAWKALDVLLTCRKIYKEACAIPFKEGTFSFEYRGALGQISGISGAFPAPSTAQSAIPSPSLVQRVDG
jgi:hypothetical protein